MPEQNKYNILQQFHGTNIQYDTIHVDAEAKHSGPSH